jgi:hypothetical protein
MWFASDGYYIPQKSVYQDFPAKPSSHLQDAPEKC